MSGNVLEVQALDDRDWLATQISYNYENWHSQMRGRMEELKELRGYLFATSTADTSNSSLPWTNTTTTPKLCQIRDNLHANYMDALFPNDKPFKWQGSDTEGDTVAKREAIEGYMQNKTDNTHHRNTVSRLVYDYIDGNAFSDVEYVREMHTDPSTGEEVPGFIGPRLVRVDPTAIVFNPTAVSFEESPKITRLIKSFGELEIEAANKPEMQYLTEAISDSRSVRGMFSGFDIGDQLKSESYAIEGFGSLMEYYQSPYVEILEFEGNIRDEAGTLLTNYLITVIDRRRIIRSIPNPSWLGRSSKHHVGWRLRPDNLWAMGPLDNLVGMQYRIDHLENSKADMYDLMVMPPLKIKGNVEAFEWGPLAEIYLGDDGDIDTLKIDSAAVQADQQIAILEQKMEDFAGAPKQAMGIRTPGEKTAFEVQSLDNASGRIFNNKTINFEANIIEPSLNDMLEVSRRNIDGMDLVRVMDDDIGVSDFLKITRDDITAEGRLKPVGARHYAARNQLVQNVTGVFNTAVGQMIAPHVSSKALASLVEEAFGWERFDLVSDNVGVIEQQETQRLVQSGQEQLDTEAATPPVEELENEEEF